MSNSKKSHSIRVKTLTIRAHDVLALKEDERYAYYMLGHMFNEMMFLQKLLHFATPVHEDRRPLRIEPEIAQTLFLIGVVAGKVWEIKLAFDEQRMSQVLRESFWPLLDDGSKSWARINRKIQKATWLKDVRNGHSFHYPSAKDWNSMMRPTGGWTDDKIYVGEISGNTFYQGSAVTAHTWMFGGVDQANPQSAVTRTVDQSIDFLTELNNLLEELLGKFITARLMTDESEPKEIDKVIAPDFTAVKLPFWTFASTRGEQ